jgi:penicillin amidase
MRRALIVLALWGCHPLTLYAPPELPQSLESGSGARIEVLVDDRGIPHVYASSLPDAAFALGFMHGRDRLFQVILLQHAAQGRLAELFGEELLETDRRLRLLAWGLDEGVQALSDADRRILEGYTAGLNTGAQNAGKSAEMALLKLDVPHFTAKDPLSILRLQAWQLGVDHLDELARLRVLSALPEGDARRALIDAPITTGGVSVTGLGDSVAALSMAGPLSGGASNSWAVDGAHTASGHAIISNDPHLDHMAPGVFYLAHLEAPGLMVAGATLPGAPIIAIGHGRKVAWAMTSSFADTQDLLRIVSPPGRDDVYELDGELVPFERVEQTFRTGKRTLTETWRATRFGPLLPPGYIGVHQGEQLALDWGAFDAKQANGEVVTGFFDLARARNVDEAGVAVEKIRGSSQNVLLAFTDGSIAYRLAAFTPRRPPGETGRVPRDGARSTNGFTGFLPLDERPKVDAPTSGYLVAANQRVIGDTDPRVGSVGTIGVPPSRALRIHRRLDALLARGPAALPTADELLAIQQDVDSVEAPAIAQQLAALCPADEPEVCNAVAAFDGRFSADSWSALPYKLLVEAVCIEVVRAFGGIEESLVVPIASSLPVRNAVGVALRSGDALVDRALVARAAKQAHAELKKRAGRSPSQWRYGRLHTLQLKGALSRAPIFGSFFEGPVHEEPGDDATVRAEGGLPIRHGACLRMLVELSDPPVGRFTLDTGQSGHPRTEHWLDQYEDWSRGTPRKLPTVRAEVEAAARARLELLP